MIIRGLQEGRQRGRVGDVGLGDYYVDSGQL